MKILFSMRHPGLVRNFEPLLCRLAERGHDVHTVSDQHGTDGDQDLTRELSRRWPTLAFDRGPCHKSAVRHSAPFIWSDLAQRTRASLDYLHYQQPAFDRATGLRGRLEKRTPRSVLRASRLPLARGRRGIRLLESAIGTLEHALPWHPEVERFLARHQPDVLLVSPLIWFGSPQVDYVRAARALGIKSAMCVGGWDNLTTKGAIYALPDLVTVWNETQKKEVITLHNVPADRVAVTGAHIYDHWFGWPASPRQAFCDRAGLAVDRPFVLYACSSRSVAPFESAFIDSWLARVRGADRPALRHAGILIRPHPENVQPWHALAAREGVVVWPRDGANPLSCAAKADYFDSLYHSAAVVGVNTSAFIEAGIAGRPVFSLLSPEFADAQERTIHFHSLVTANGGVVRVAHDLDSHLEHLASALTTESDAQPLNQEFLRTFVRPLGVDCPATDHLVRAIERLGEAPRRRPAVRWHWSQVMRPVLFPVAVRRASAAFVLRQRANGKPTSSASAYRRVLFHPTAGLFPFRSVRAAGARVLDVIFLSPAIRKFTREHLVPRAMPELTQQIKATPSQDASREIESHPRV